MKAQDASLMASVLSQCIRNPQGIRQFGNQLADVIPFPTSYQTKVQCPDGQKKTIAERLATVAPVPVDDRVREIASAGLFAATLASCEIVNIVLPNSDDLAVFHFAASTLLTLIITITVVDNFYDLLKTASQFVVSQAASKVNATADDASKFQLPDKADLPAGIGTGQLTGSVVRGLTRLTTVNAEREAACEAAALYTAYVLGLPCFAFRPNALEASVLVVESSSSTSSVSSLLTPSGIMRMLIWLMAGPAMESAAHAQLIMSDPREGSGFLQRLEDYYSSSSSSSLENALFWTSMASPSSGSSAREDVLKWAYTEADLLLRSNKNAVQELSNRLASGAATIGDCVAVIEEWQ